MKSDMSLNTLTRRAIKQKPKDHQHVVVQPNFRHKKEEDNESDSDSASEKCVLYPDISSELEEIAETSPPRKSKEFLRVNEQSYNKHPRKVSIKNDIPNPVTLIVYNTLIHQLKHVKNNSKMFLITFIFIFVVIILYFCAPLFTRSQSSMEMHNVAKVMIKLKSKFHNQPEWTYKILSSALKQVVNVTEPSAPAIITVLANPGAAETAKEFCAHLAKLLVPEDYVMIDGTEYDQGSNDDIKLKIDEEIKSKVEFSSLNVVVVSQLEKIPLAATMIFHSYCDHDNAIFKRMVYLFVLSLNEDLKPTANPKDLDYAAIKHFKETWNDAHPDVFNSLITRLTVSVINVKQD